MTVAALEIGGSHVSAAVVQPSGVVGPVARGRIDGSADAATLLAAITSVANRTAGGGAAWGVAMPGPFDYAAGVGRFRGVGKFEDLDGVDIGAALRASLRPPPVTVRFVNDAIAFALGEWTSGSGRGRDRLVALTLGTGIGSAFLEGGRPVTAGPSVPPEGRADLLTSQGGPLEETVSTRAILAAYHGRADRTVGTVAEIARRAAAGDPAATHVLASAFRALGVAIADYIRAFEAEALVIGGGISAAWSQVEPPLRAGLGIPGLPIERSADTELSALRGAALTARGAPFAVRDDARG